MSTILLHVARALTPATEIPGAGILIRDGVIEAIGPRQGMRLPSGAAEISASGQTAIPGFIDVHIHGAGGHDVMEGTEQAMSAVAKRLARHGTTSFLATTVTASPDDTCRSVEGIAHYITRQFEATHPKAEVLGIHYEGPFLTKCAAACIPPSGSNYLPPICCSAFCKPPPATLASSPSRRSYSEPHRA